MPSVTWPVEDMNVIMLRACTDCKLYCFCSISHHSSYWQSSLLSDLMLYALCWWKSANLAACCYALCIYLQLIVWAVNVVSFTVPNGRSWRLLVCRFNSPLIISSISLLYIRIHSLEGRKLFAELEIKSLWNGVKHAYCGKIYFYKHIYM